MTNIFYLGIIYLVFSFFLFLYGIKSYNNSLKSYLYSIALNVFPLILSGYLGESKTRFFRIPIAYFPIIAGIMSSIVLSKFRLLKRYKTLYVLYMILISYLFLQSFVFVGVKHLDSFLEYYLMWVVNIYAMFVVSYVVVKIPYEILLSILKNLVLLIVICAFVGIFKYIIGIQYDANFMPMMNRNGTVFLVVLTIPILLLIRDLGLIKPSSFLVCLLIYILNILFIKSRMGILGFIFSYLIYYLFKYKFKLHILIPSVIIFMGLILAFLYSPIGNYLLYKLEMTVASIRMIVTSGEISPGMSDYRRFQLLVGAVEIIKSNLLFGTGVGLGNYLEKLNVNVIPAKAHNFYLSYLAEFGIIGFSILIIFLIVLWSFFRKIPDKNFYITFQTIFLSVIFMFTMNEYITFPLLWVIWGIGLGLSGKNRYSGESNYAL